MIAFSKGGKVPGDKDCAAVAAAGSRRIVAVGTGLGAATDRVARWRRPGAAADTWASAAGHRPLASVGARSRTTGQRSAVAARRPSVEAGASVVAVDSIRVGPSGQAEGIAGHRLDCKRCCRY